MTNLHILLDPVTDVWKCPKRGFKRLVPHSATRLAAPVTLTPHRVEYGVTHPLTPSSSHVTVLYCTVLYCTVLYLGAHRAPKSPLEELEVGGHRLPFLVLILGG